MNLEQLGIQITDQEQVLEIEGRSLAEMALYLHGHAINLDMVATVLESVEQDYTPERLAGVRKAIGMMAEGVRGNVAELLRVMREQGLRFTLVGEQRPKH